MEESVLNRVLSDAWSSASGDWNAYRDQLEVELSKLSPEQLSDYPSLFVQRVSRLMTPGIVCAAKLFNDGLLSDDTFLNFVDCLAGSPGQFYRPATKNADSLIQFPEIHSPQTLFFEQAAAGLSDSEFDPDSTDGLEDIEYEGRRGIAIPTEATMRSLVPRLWKEYGGIDLSR